MKLPFRDAIQAAPVGARLSLGGRNYRKVDAGKWETVPLHGETETARSIDQRTFLEYVPHYASWWLW